MEEGCYFVEIHRVLVSANEGGGVVVEIDEIAHGHAEIHWMGHKITLNREESRMRATKERSKKDNGYFKK